MAAVFSSRNRSPQSLLECKSSALAGLSATPHMEARGVSSRHIHVFDPRKFPVGRPLKMYIGMWSPQKGRLLILQPTEHEDHLRSTLSAVFSPPSNPRTKRCSLEKASLSLVSALLTQRKLRVFFLLGAFALLLLVLKYEKISILTQTSAFPPDLLLFGTSFLRDLLLLLLVAIFFSACS